MPITDYFGRTGKVFKDKAEDLVNTTKIKNQMNDKQQEIQDDFTTLGKNYYQKYGNDQTGEFYEICQKITLGIAQIEQLNQELLNLKNVKICPNCGSENDKASLFCGECGQRLQEEMVHTNMSNGKCCSNCGMPLEEGARFCKKCGSKVEEQSVEIEELVQEEEEKKPRICKGCGEVLEDDALFCTNCGMKND